MMNSENDIVQLYLDDIIPNRFQPREHFDEKALNELAASIKEHGIIQPIIVRPIGEKYEIIAGERRYKASAIAGLTKIPAIIRPLDDKESSKIALLENLQRKDLSAIEEARTYQKILEIDQMTQEELAKSMGKSQSSIANKLRLLTLPDEVQDALLKEQISERHARSLLNIRDSSQQLELLNRIIETRMTVRELDEEIKQINNKDISKDQYQSSAEYTPKFFNFNSSHEEEPEIPKADIDSLLGIGINKHIEESQNVEEKQEVEQPRNDLDEENSLFNEIKLDNIELKPVPIEIPKSLSMDESVEVLDDITNNLETDDEKFSEISSNYQAMSPGLKEAINVIRDTTRSIEGKGIVVDTEELDLDNEYQIIIKIKKEEEK